MEIEPDTIASKITINMLNNEYICLKLCYKSRNSNVTAIRRIRTVHC